MSWRLAKQRQQRGGKQKVPQKIAEADRTSGEARQRGAAAGVRSRT